MSIADDYGHGWQAGVQVGEHGPRLTSEPSQHEALLAEVARLTARLADVERCYDAECDTTTRLEAEREALVDPEELAEADRRIVELEARLREVEQERDSWFKTAAEMSNNAEFYRGLVTRCGQLFGDDAKRSDDGSMQDSVLALKVPELVEQQTLRLAALIACARALLVKLDEKSPYIYAELAALRAELDKP